MTHLVDDFLSYMQASKGASRRTIETYRDSLENAADFFVKEKGEAADWLSLVTDDFRVWEAEQMHRGYNPSYVKKNMAALRSMYRFLLQEGKVKVDPVRLVKNPKQGKRLPSFVKEGEMDRLFDYYDFGEGYDGIRDRTLVLLLYHTGIRASELTELDLHDIDLAGASLRVTGKGNKQRVIPFGPELQDALREYLVAREEFVRDLRVSLDERPGERQPLFLGKKGARISYNHLRVVVKDALSTVTTQKRRGPHTLRHSFATAMLAHGAQLEAIQQLLGHESVSTTAIYTHTTIAELKDQYAAAHPRHDKK